MPISPRRRPALGAAVLAGAAGFALSPPAAPADLRVERAGRDRVHVSASGAPLAEVLARIGAAAGVPIRPLAGPFDRRPVTIEAGPAPVEEVVRQIVRPRAMAVLYPPAGAPGGPVTIVVLPADGGPWAAPAAVAPAVQAAPSWQEADVGPGAQPGRREAAVLALGEALDDPEAVALLESVARGQTGLAPEDPARLLAARALESVPGGTDEGDAD